MTLCTNLSGAALGQDLARLACGAEDLLTALSWISPADAMGWQYKRSTETVLRDLQVQLSRFDLFHGHLFRDRNWPHGLGILFHALEYPAYGGDFGVELGFCQTNSNARFSQRAWDARNWLFYKVNTARQVLLCSCLTQHHSAEIAVIPRTATLILRYTSVQLLSDICRSIIESWSRSRKNCNASSNL